MEDCRKDFKELDIYTRLMLIKNRYSQLEPPCYEFTKTGLFMNLINFKNYFSDLTDLYIYHKGYGTHNESENGVYEESVIHCKHNFRRMFRNDLEISKLYFKAICERYQIEITKNLEFYFEKFIYTYNPFQVFLPEYDFSLFLAAYFIDRNEFDGSSLESKIFTDLSCSRIRLMKKLKNFFRYLEFANSPEQFITKLKYRNKKRFLRLRNSIEFIEGYKRNLISTLSKEKDERPAESNHK